MILDIERVAHGGLCVARAPDGRVVFVRHTLPGERVRAEIVEERRRYLRADAVEILRSAPARVVPPCPWAGPGRCGGCDWQHVDVAEQRRLKAAVVAEQLQRLAGVEWTGSVEALPGDPGGLGWRTRMRLAVDDHGRAGLHRYRSHEVEPIDDCLIAVPGADIPDVVRRPWPADAEVVVEVSSSGERAVAMGAPAQPLTELAIERSWSVPIGGFWQVHPAAPQTLVDAMLAAAEPRPEDIAWDLYSGVGLFAGALASRTSRVWAVESDRRAGAAARDNLADLGNVTHVTDRVDRWLAAADPAVDVVVLDPPRRGAGREVSRRLAAATRRMLVYVACDPAALARDTATLVEGGLRLDGVRAFDLFPMTAHVECVAVFRR